MLPKSIEQHTPFSLPAAFLEVVPSRLATTHSLGLGLPGHQNSENLFLKGVVARLAGRRTSSHFKLFRIGNGWARKLLFASSDKSANNTGKDTPLNMLARKILKITISFVQ